MRRLTAAGWLLFAAVAVAQEFPLGPDSRPREGTPKGEVLKFSFENSKVFPGTQRDYWIYVPAQYRPQTPACLYVNQDGIQWNAPTVFDNLIHAGEMPVTIGVFVMHGRVRAAEPAQALDRFNRSYEYDGLGGDYGRFLLTELLPDVEAKKSSDGRPIRLSRAPQDRAIGGSSSGAIAAFTVAWEYPDSFSRVFSAIGTYVGLRGGDRYPTLIRKYEPRPLRIFLQDGSNDLNIYAGDWWMANQTMERALQFAGYEVQHVWGEGGHSNAHGAAIFPDAMRWLWKGWPERVKAGVSKNGMLNDILTPGETWNPVTLSQGAENLPLGRTSRGSLTISPDVVKGPGDRIYILNRDSLTVTEPGKRSRTLAKLRSARRLVAASNGNVYVTAPAAIWLVRPDGSKSLVDSGTSIPQGREPGSGITLSTDQTLLYVADAASHWVYSYQIQPDGALRHRQRYYWLHTPDDSDESGAGSLCVDTAGRLYAATRLGIQVCDQAGRVNCILPVPGGPVDAVSFGGRDLTTLYARTGETVFARRLKARGAPAWAAPVKPAPPRL